MDINEIRALVSLLDDDDQEVIQHIEQKILSLGEVIIPFLESEWDNNYSPEVQTRIEELIHGVQFKSLQEKLKDWKEDDSDLLKGLYLVATYQFPDLEFKKIKKEVDKVYYEIWLSHRTYASPFDQVKNLNNILFTKLNFHATSTENFHSPSNSMLNLVLESHRGNPIALASIYLLVAKKLRMPIYGVNLPNLFILTYKSEETQFYINAFNKGKVFSRTEIDAYIKQLKIEPRPEFYEPCTHLEIVQRVLRNLIHAYEKSKEEEKAQEVGILLELSQQAS